MHRSFANNISHAKQFWGDMQDANTTLQWAWQDVRAPSSEQRASKRRARRGRSGPSSTAFPCEVAVERLAEVAERALRGARWSRGTRPPSLRMHASRRRRMVTPHPRRGRAGDDRSLLDPRGRLPIASPAIQVTSASPAAASAIRAASNSDVSRSWVLARVRSHHSLRQFFSTWSCGVDFALIAIEIDARRSSRSDWGVQSALVKFTTRLFRPP